MDIKNIILKYAKYNHWANQSMITWVRNVDRNVIFEETPSSFPNIDRTLQHMKNAQRFWLTVLAKGNFRDLDETIILNDADKVMDLLISGSQTMIETFANYVDEDLNEKVTNGESMQSRFDFILHVINHNSYHRGQIVTMARRLGITENIPCVDYEYFIWLEK